MKIVFFLDLIVIKYVRMKVYGYEMTEKADSNV